jgi:hypothetical protein
MSREILQPPLLAEVFRAAAVLPCWPRCFDASIEAYASRDPFRVAFRAPAAR